MSSSTAPAHHDRKTHWAVETIGYDAFVLAPGTTTIRPPVPGLDSPRVLAF